jgi:hypothetical protein
VRVLAMLAERELHCATDSSQDAQA